MVVLGLRNDLKGVDCKIDDEWAMLNGISTNHYTLSHINGEAQD
jgi:hypothetical protein